MQHAWAEIEHDLGYKSKNEVPKEIRRDFSRVAGLLELADKEFIRIREYLNKYKAEVDNNIKNAILRIPIDKITLREYLDKSEIVDQINETLAKKNGGLIRATLGFGAERNIAPLNNFDIKTISDLDSLLKENEENIIRFFDEWTDKGKGVEVLPYDTPLFYLYYVLLYKNYSVDKLLDYMEVSEISKEETLSIDKALKNLIAKGFTLS